LTYNPKHAYDSQGYISSNKGVIGNIKGAKAARIHAIGFVTQLEHR
jgi:hypothetical protein